MNICPYKGKLKDGQKSCQNGTLIHCLAPNSELIFDVKKLARNQIIFYMCEHKIPFRLANFKPTKIKLAKPKKQRNPAIT